jgi:CBS domain-containing protein
MVREFRTLRSDEPLSRAVELLLEGSQQDFPVVDAGPGSPPVGILAKSDLLTALASGDTGRTVGEVARSTCGVAHPREMLEAVFQRMGAAAAPRFRWWRRTAAWWAS